MIVVNGFTRKEAQSLCQVEEHRLTYLDRTGLIVPYRIGKGKRPTVIYTFTQILEIRAIGKLREQVSLQTVRKIVEKFNDQSLANKSLIVINGEVYQYLTGTLENVAMQLSGENKGQFTMLDVLIIPPLQSYADEVLDLAKKSKIIDFNSFKERAMIA
ncbi:MAG: MerR family transcriptional regulator [Planktothrix sp.]